MNRSRARKHWLLIALLLGVAVILLVRGWIFQTVASGLVVNENCPITDYVWIAECEHGADRRFDHAAELYRKHPSLRLILVGQYRQRLVQIGAQPSQEAIDRRELASRGVPAKTVIVIPGSAQNAWEEAQRVTSWMASRPGAEVLLLCDQFDSRRQRRIVDSVMDASHAKRIHIHPLADRRHNENDWWQSRDGVTLHGTRHRGLQLCADHPHARVGDSPRHAGTGACQHVAGSGSAVPRSRDARMA